MLGLLSALLGLAKIVAQMCHDNKLMDAGEAKAISENLTNAMDKIKKANAARSSVPTDSVSISNDPNNRDGH